jgi:hypothetical protein
MGRLLPFVLVSALVLPAAPAMASIQWFSLGTHELPAGQDPKTVSFDLADAGLASARYLRILDGGNGL